MSDREVALRFFRTALPLIVHGLKNRLTPAVTQTYLLEESSTLAPDKIRNIAHSAVQSLERSLALLSALPRLVDFETGKTIDAEVGSWLAAVAVKHGVELRCAGPSRHVTLDAGLWGAALDEVLLNVVTHGGGRAEAAWSGEGDRLEIRLRDQGEGLGNMEPTKALEATRRSETSPGQGLGLARATLAMLLLDGSVRVEAGNPGVEAVLEGRLMPAS